MMIAIGIVWAQGGAEEDGNGGRSDHSSRGERDDVQQKIDAMDAAKANATGKTMPEAITEELEQMYGGIVCYLLVKAVQFKSNEEILYCSDGNLQAVV